jgi:transcriptional regulator with XRE-family HTH domain
MSAEEFRAWYESRGYTQAEMVELLDVGAQPRISEWASGRQSVPRYIAAHLRTLERLEQCEEGRG